MAEIFGSLAQATGIIEKGGIIGLLVIFCAFLIYERFRLMKQNVRIFRQRDKARMLHIRYKSACDHAGISVATNDIEKMFEDDMEEEATNK